MIASYADAMVDVLSRTFEMMFEMKVALYERRQEENQIPPFEVSGVIGITGPITGCVVLSFPAQFAREMAARTFGEEPLESGVPEEDVYDCVGEVANVVGGNILPALSSGGQGQFRLSLPSVVVGSHRVVWRRKDTPYELLLLKTELGDFAAGINLREGEE